jgi:predicted peptidase
MTTKNIITTLSCAIFLLFSCKKDVSPAEQQAVSSSSEDYYTEKTLPSLTPINQSIDADIGGYLQALPASYADHPGKRYPLLIFLQGTGGMGDGSIASLTQIENGGIPGCLKRKTLPANFTVNGETYQFIYFTPQFKIWPGPSEVNDVVNFAMKKFRVDSSKVYITGLSMGGGVLWNYAAAYGNRLAAIVPISGASGPDANQALEIAQSGVCIWAFHNDGDPRVPVYYTQEWVKLINLDNPRVPARMTIFNADKHNAWSAAYDTAYKEHGQNIFEWMLSKHDIHY